MNIVDTHAHLDMPEFEADLTQVLQRAGEAGVRQIICVGTTLDSSRRCVKLSRQHPNRIYATVGIHPNYCCEPGEDADELERLATLPQVVAIGETGLDFHHDYASQEQQERFFRRHIRLSLSVGKPLIVHARKADERTIAIMAEEAQMIHGVRHCFDSSAQIAAGYLERGLHIGFGGIITRAGHKKLKRAARTVPDERLLVETDCPYMTPRGAESGRNEPAFIRGTVRALAGLRGRSDDTIAEVTSRNARRLFLGAE
jgi:TatD DNase family protein